METKDYIRVGMKSEVSFLVETEHTAVHVGSGSLKVLATPIMVAYMERAARDLLAALLPAGYSSVGVHVDVRHLAPTPRVARCGLSVKSQPSRARLWISACRPGTNKNWSAKAPTGELSSTKNAF